MSEPKSPSTTPSNQPPNFHYPPPPTSFLRLTYPHPSIILLTMSRPAKLNATTSANLLEITRVFAWFDDEPTLSVAILTGSGRAFSTGADLTEWKSKISAPDARPGAGPGDAAGVIPLSNRVGRKPIIAAVNGLALGGGCETVVNCDIVVAADTAVFGLVEVRRGLAAYAGALPRLIRSIGLQRASEMALTGRYITATEAERWGFVNKVVPLERVVDEAVEMAKLIVMGSLDAIVTTRAGLRQGWETSSVVEATAVTGRREWRDLQRGGDMREGLKAFEERREPRWTGSKL